jgi:hypothetical protein
MSFPDYVTKIRRKAPAFRHGDIRRLRHVERSKQQQSTGTEPGTMEPFFDNLMFLVPERRSPGKTSTMIRNKPGDNQARHLNPPGSLRSAQDAAKVGWGASEPALSQEGANAQGEVLRPDISGAPRGTVESPPFRDGERQP